MLIKPNKIKLSCQFIMNATIKEARAKKVPDKNEGRIRDNSCRIARCFKSQTDLDELQKGYYRR